MTWLNIASLLMLTACGQPTDVDRAHLHASTSGHTAIPLLKAGARWSMEIGWASDTVFDLTGWLQPGDTVVTIEIVSTGNILNFDVYEGRSW